MTPRWSSLSRPLSRPLAALLLVVTLAGCAPDAAAGSQRVDIEGIITAVTASAGGKFYVVEVADQGLLPLDVGDARPPMNAGGVVVQVPDSLDIPADAAGMFAALDDYVQQTGQSLVVVDFLP